jgi:hypothetical protein
LKSRAEYLAQRVDKKEIIFDLLVDLVKKEYSIDIIKNYAPELSTTSDYKTKKLLFLPVI